MKKIFYMLFLGLVLASCTSGPQGRDGNGSLRYEKASAFLVYTPSEDPDGAQLQEMALNFDLGLSWWNRFRVTGGKMEASSGFTQRNSRILNQKEAGQVQGRSLMIRTVEAEFTALPDLPSRSQLHKVSLPLTELSGAEGLLLKARMDLVLSLGIPEGWIRLADLRAEGGNLVMTWDLRF